MASHIVLLSAASFLFLIPKMVLFDDMAVSCRSFVMILRLSIDLYRIAEFRRYD